MCFNKAVMSIKSQFLPGLRNGHVTRCNFSCNLQCNSTLERCKIAKYESSLHSADVFSTYRNFFTDFTKYHLSRVELHCKLQEKLHRVTWPLVFHLWSFTLPVHLH
jgi:hypothetical protein